ncbi:MAG TPA: hypothetical protein VGD38_14310 [Pyrinomonadaceae bacterium]
MAYITHRASNTHHVSLLTRRVLFVVCLLALLLPTIPVSRTTAQDGVLRVRRSDNYEISPRHIHIGRMTQEYRELLREKFKRGRDLLMKKGVPFEPNDLLEPGWRKKLKPKFAQMPELRETRVLTQRQIRGV